jgi:glycosyltransferase involved in cell wall biosynthesis
VLASDEEGFGLPLAEALVCGAACVVSDAPALVEVAGGAALHFPRGDSRALAVALERALDDEERDRLRIGARARGRELGWAEPVKAWERLLSAITSSVRNRDPVAAIARVPS